MRALCHELEILILFEASGRTAQQASIEETVETSPLDELSLAEPKGRHHHATAAHPAFGHHYDGAKDEEAVVRIIGMGPVTTKQLEASARGQR